MEKKFLKKLNRLCKDMDSRYNLNSGGCVYCAYLIAKKLEKLGIGYSVKRYLYSSTKELYHISLIVNEIEINPSTFKTHCYNYVPSTIINSKGLMLIWKKMMPHRCDDYKLYHNVELRKRINELFDGLNSDSVV